MNNTHTTQLVLVVSVLLCAVAACAAAPILDTTIATALPGGALPDMPVKPKPAEETFHGCPASGDGSDRELNRLKNRIDEGAYVSVSLHSILSLTWPQTIARKQRVSWSNADRNAIARYEGIPLVVEAYLFGAKEEGPEATNCHGADSPDHDYHIWITPGANDARDQAVVVEMTPRVRAKHTSWSATLLDRLGAQHSRVRVSGWLMMDQEHPDQIGNTRGTIWEIHPVMRFEVSQNGSYVDLDALR